MYARKMVQHTVQQEICIFRNSFVQGVSDYTLPFSQAEGRGFESRNPLNADNQRLTRTNPSFSIPESIDKIAKKVRFSGVSDGISVQQIVQQ